MTDDTYSLAEARAIIDAEKCVRDRVVIASAWCVTHQRAWGPLRRECRAYPELADVAAQLLATVERVQALADEWATEVKLGVWCGDCVAPDPERIELLAAINGEEVTE